MTAVAVASHRVRQVTVQPCSTRHPPWSAPLATCALVLVASMPQLSDNLVCGHGCGEALQGEPHDGAAGDRDPGSAGLAGVGDLFEVQVVTDLEVDRHLHRRLC